MSLANQLKKICESLGRNNKPTYVVMAIAATKGIFRPIITMTDKKEPPETKKYAALREGLTEVIAIPTYWACGELAGKASKLVKDPVKQPIARANMMFIGVCTAALLIIPALCSVTVKPFTDKIFKKGKKDIKQSENTLNIENKEVTFKGKSLNKNYVNNKLHTNNIYSIPMNSGVRI